ncbi:hypothetical protein ABMA28_006549 [Loxostege sticticalis]|uniref:Uncharacterized protein n=1 Tax=Loxostege sticticalis TaxID=481309 RepID=A0ABD0SLL1_LOXSC
MDVAAGLHEEIQLIIDLADGLPKSVPDGFVIELQNAAQFVATIGQRLLANSKVGPKTESQEMKYRNDQEDKFEEQIEKLRAESNSYCKELVSLRSAIHGRSGDSINCDDSDLADKYAALSAGKKISAGTDG